MATEEVRQHDLAQTLSAVARDMERQSSVSDTLSAMTAAAVSTITGADFAGITLAEPGRVVAGQAHTHETARKCDELQEELKEGPCLSAIAEQHTVLVPDMSVETRWPGFAAGALDLGINSMTSFQLYAERGSFGALNLYGTAPYAFAADAQLVGELFATHAAVAWAGASEARQLNTALATRDTIGQAKGMLMQRENVDGVTAFNMLVRASQQTNIKVSEVAAWLVGEHERPGEASRPAAGGAS